jgi:hypothetical protein
VSSIFEYTKRQKTKTPQFRHTLLKQRHDHSFERQPNAHEINMYTQEIKINQQSPMDSHIDMMHD